MLQGLDLSRFFFAVLSWTSLKFSLTTMNIAAILRCSNALHHIQLRHNIFHIDHRHDDNMDSNMHCFNQYIGSNEMGWYSKNEILNM